MRDPRQTRLAVVALLVKRAGYRQAGQLMEFIDDWKDFLAATDAESPSFQSYARWTRRYSHRSAYRRLALLRATFPEGGPELTPGAFLTPLIDRLRAEAGAELAEELLREEALIE